MSTQPPITPDQPDQEDPKVAQLIREAKAAIKIGDKDSARTKLQEAVALDQYSEQGWYWLAAVVSTDEERKTCLGNVVVINPNNKRALDMLDKLNGNLNAGLLQHEDALLTGEAEVKTPPNRRILIIGGGAAVVVLLALFLLTRPSAPPPSTPTLSTQGVAGVSTEVSNAVATVVATSAVTATASPTLAAVQPTLPPTWTPPPSVTASGAIGTPLAAPPAELTGHLVVLSGSLLTGKGNLPVFLLDPAGKKLKPVTSEVGDDAILTPDGLRLIYSRFIASTDSFQLRLMNSNGTQPGELSRLWGNVPPLANVKQPSISRNGKLLVFSASSLTENDATPDIFAVSTTSLVNLTSGSAAESDVVEGPATENVLTATPIPTDSSPATISATGGPVTPVKRITPKDSGINTWPASSPDGNKIVYVNDGRTLGKDSVDIYIVPAAGGEAQNLTRDNLVLIEGAPEYSPNGAKIAFHAASESAKTNNIFVMDADGTNKVQLTDGVGDNIRPHWSPDGKYIAFSSTRNGKWEIYIIDVQTQALYQVTQTQASTIVTGWSPN